MHDPRVTAGYLGGRLSNPTSPVIEVGARMSRKGKPQSGFEAPTSGL